MSEVLAELTQRIQQMPNADELVLRTDFEALVKTVFDAMVEDDEFQRKMRFPTDGDRRLAGSKFARFGLNVGDIEYLYDLQVALRDSNPAKYTGPSEELTNAFDHISEARYIPQDKIREIDKAALDNVFPRVPKGNFSGRDQHLFERGRFDEMEAYQQAVRAMDTAESGYGSQLIGAQYVGELWSAARMASRIFGLIETFEMQHPTAYLPVEADIPEMLFVSESTASNSSNYTTSKTGSNRVQVDAKKFVIHQMWSGEMEEDSIIPFVNFLRRQVRTSLAHYSDSVVLNGDTTNAATGNINLDDADPADTKHYLAFDGLRHAPIVDNTGNDMNIAGAITWSKLNEAPVKMVDTTYLMHWGSPTASGDLVYLVDPFTAAEVRNLDEIVAQKNERQRALINGQIADIVGHPVIESIAMSKTEADGKVSTTGTNNIKGQIVVFNRRAFVVGWRRRLRTQVESLPATDQMRMVHSLRLGFGRYSPTGAASGIEAAVVLRNITLP